MIPGAVIYGIDMVESNTRNAPEGIYNELVIGRFEEYDPPKPGFDAIIFSSVLHEIGSYAEIGRFKKKPVRNALQHAFHLLNQNGVVVIREGLAESRSHKGEFFTAELEKEEDWLRLLRFCDERPLDDKEKALQAEGIRFRPELLPGAGYRCTVKRDILREFLCTWTWGDKSWSREIQERFCYLSAREWEDLLSSCEYEVITNIQSSEEYPKYFRKIIKNFETESPLIGVFVGRKK